MGTEAVDAVIKFGKSAPRAWQTSVAFDWIETIIDDRYGPDRESPLLLEEWLSELRDAGLIPGEVKNQLPPNCRRMAAAGDRAAVRLQQLDELVGKLDRALNASSLTTSPSPVLRSPA